MARLLHFNSKDEMDHDERARLRRTKKARRRKARQAANADSRLVSRLNPGMGNPHEHARASEIGAWAGARVLRLDINRLAGLPPDQLASSASLVLVSFHRVAAP